MITTMILIAGLANEMAIAKLVGLMIISVMLETTILYFTRMKLTSN